MDDAAPDGGTYRDHAVWRRIAAHVLGPADAEQSFAQRLAKENGWSAGEAERVIEEYRRFCFLAATAPHPVTPSEMVDQAWHLHLCYSRDYWQVFCPEVLGRELHHGPTRGGAAERDKHYEQYAMTLKTYEKTFGPAPEDIWPDSYKRFYIDPQARRVNPREYLIIPRRQAMGLAIVAIFVIGGLLIDRWLG